MGLDMYLERKRHLYSDERKNLKISGVTGVRPERVKQIVEEAGYWRKANAIHGWFVDNVQEGTDDRKEYNVTHEDIETLLNIVKKVLKASTLVKGKIQNGFRFENGKKTPIMVDGEFIKNPTVAKKLLPVREGFFFGNYNEETAYDQYYYQDLLDTVKILEKAIADEKGDYYYHSSW